MVKDSKGELLAFHQEVKRFQKERICWHSTNQCNRVYFDSHTWQESVSVILTLKRFLRVYRLQSYGLTILNWSKESFKFFLTLNGRMYNAAIVSYVNPASILKMNFWYTLTCTLPPRPIGGYYNSQQTSYSCIKDYWSHLTESSTFINPLPPTDLLK